jgi:hypothetical protein
LRGRRSGTARFDPPRPEPAWVSSDCVRLHAASAIAGGAEVAAYCVRLAPGATPIGPTLAELIRLDAATGQVLARAPLPTVGYAEEHAVLDLGATIAVRAADHVLAIDGAGRARFDLVMPQSFGLAATERGILVAQSGAGLVEIDGSTGAVLRRIDDPSLIGAPDPFTSSLGLLTVRDGVAYVEARGRIIAIALADGSTRWIAGGTDLELDDRAVYACRGSRFVELDRATGSTRSSYSTGGCAIVGVAGSTVLVRYEAMPSFPRHEDLAWAGLVAFERRPGPAPACERATVRGVVRVNGVVAPGITVRAGNAWAVESSGVVHGWGMPMAATDEPPLAQARTDREGRYALTICDRGHVPIVVDPEQARSFAGEEDASEFATYVHLSGVRDYTADFAIRAHGPTM